MFLGSSRAGGAYPLPLRALRGKGNRLRCGVAAQNIYDTARSLVSAAGQQAMISSLVTT
jgi:hypothetical protein